MLLGVGVLGFFFKDSIFGDAVEKAKGAVEKTADMAGDAAKGAADMAGDAAGAMGDAAKGAMGAVGDVFSKVDDVALKALDGIKFTAGSAGSQMMDFVKGGFKGDGRFTFKNLTFASGSAKIDGATAVEVDNMASILKAYPGVSVSIEGYTDSQGPDDSNLQLSEARAQAVMARLIGKGISGDRIMAKGFGEADPKGDNNTAEGRAMNRRIEMVISK